MQAKALSISILAAVTLMAGCSETVRDVPYYKAHPDEMNATVKKCQEEFKVNPAKIKSDQNCINAAFAFKEANAPHDKSYFMQHPEEIDAALEKCEREKGDRLIEARIECLGASWAKNELKSK